jgi:hypothetical protein
MKRAALDAAKKGIMSVGKGIFGAGEFAVKAIAQNKDDEKK